MHYGFLKISEDWREVSRPSRPNTTDNGDYFSPYSGPGGRELGESGPPGMSLRPVGWLGDGHVFLSVDRGTGDVVLSDNEVGTYEIRNDLRPRVEELDRMREEGTAQSNAARQSRVHGEAPRVQLRGANIAANLGGALLGTVAGGGVGMLMRPTTLPRVMISGGIGAGIGMAAMDGLEKAYFRRRNDQ